MISRLLGGRQPESEAAYWDRVRAAKQQADREAEAARLAAASAPRYEVPTPDGYWQRIKDALRHHRREMLARSQTGTAAMGVTVDMSTEYWDRIRAERAAQAESGTAYRTALTLAQSQLDRHHYGISRARRTSNRAVTHSRYHVTFDGQRGRWFNTVEYGTVCTDGSFLSRFVEVQTGSSNGVNGKFALDSLGFEPIDVGGKPRAGVVDDVFNSYYRSLLNLEEELALAS